MKYINLSQGKKAIVDDEWFDFLNQFKWHYGAKGYAVRAIRKNHKKIKDEFMHRVVLGVPKAAYTDHINGNRIDNRRVNLRICTKQQNLFNQSKQLRYTKSKYKGVTYEWGKWRARIALNKKRTSLGCFSSEKEAALAYNKAAKELYGDFAKFNLA